MRNRAVTIEDLSAYIDGELTPQERVRVEEALERDETVKAQYDKLRSTTSLFTSLPSVSAPGRLKHNIRDAIRQSKEKSFFHRLREQFEDFNLFSPAVYSAAATILIVVVAVFMLTSTPQSQDSAAVDTAGPGEMLLAEADVVDDLPDAPLVEAEEKAVQPQPAERRTLGTGNARAREESQEYFAARPLATDTTGEGAMRTASGPMYRADIIETYYEPGSDNMEFEIGETASEYSIEWGREMIFNPEAPPGSDEHPFVYDSNQIPPEMPGFNFQAHTSIGAASILVQGVIHASSNGRILYFRLSGPPEARSLLQAFAERLKGHKVPTVVVDGERASVLYRFIAMLYPETSLAE